MEYKELIEKLIQLEDRVRSLEDETERYQNNHIVRKNMTIKGNIYADKLYRKNGANYQEVTS